MEASKSGERWIDIGNRRAVVLAVCAVIAVIGVVAYAFQMTGGMEGYTDIRAWSIYVAFFYSCAAAGAGMLIVTGVLSVFGLADPRTYRRAYGVALAAFIAASVFVMIDLGNPLVIFAMVTNPQPSSPLFYDMIALPVAIIVSFIGMRLVGKGARPKVSFGIVCLVLAVAVLGIESWIVVAPETKAAWGVLLGFGPSLVQSLVMALALFTLVSREYASVMKKVLALVTTFALATIVVDAASGMGSSAMGQQMASIISSPLLWAGIAIAVCGAAVQFAKARSAQVVASLLVVFSIPLLKLALIQGGQTAGNLFGATTDLVGFGALEVVASVGVIAVAVLIFVAITSNGKDKQKQGNAASVQEVQA